MSGYWPWWLGAMSLAVVTVGCCVVARRPLGVSGIVGRFVNFREELASERRRGAFAHAGDAAFEAALLAATAEAFGPAPSAPEGCGVEQAAFAPLPVARGRGGPCAGECASATARPTLGAHAVFLASIVVGSLCVQLSRGGWRLTFDLGPAFARVVGTGWRAALALLVGGMLVGIGTTVSGGCSAGHGLSGCSRLQPAGVAATASFMASAILVSLILGGRS